MDVSWLLGLAAPNQTHHFPHSVVFQLLAFQCCSLPKAGWSSLLHNCETGILLATNCSPLPGPSHCFPFPLSCLSSPQSFVPLCISIHRPLLLSGSPQWPSRCPEVASSPGIQGVTPCSCAEIAQQLLETHSGRVDGMDGGRRQLEVTPDVHSTAESAASLPSRMGAPVFSQLLNGSCYDQVLCLEDSNRELE